MKPVRIGIMTTLWKRPELTEIVLRYYYGLEVDGVEFVRQAAGSEGVESLLLATRNGWHYTEVDNEPLGAKHNAALAELCSRDVDCVVIVGSDDLLSRSYFEYVRDAYRKGCRALKVDGCYYYDAATDNTWFYKKVDCGAGRMLSYDLCRQRGFKAWPDDRERYLDGSMQHQIFQYAAPWRIKHQPEQGICVLDIKAGFNMHSLREMKDLQLESNRKLVDTEEVFNKYFPKVLGDLRKLKQQPVEERESG